VAISAANPFNIGITLFRSFVFVIFCKIEKAGLSLLLLFIRYNFISDTVYFLVSDIFLYRIGHIYIYAVITNGVD